MGTHGENHKDIDWQVVMNDAKSQKTNRRKRQKRIEKQTQIKIVISNVEYILCFSNTFKGILLYVFGSCPSKGFTLNICKTEKI